MSRTAPADAGPPGLEGQGARPSWRKGLFDNKFAFGRTAGGLGKSYRKVGLKEFSHVSEVQQREKPHKELHDLIRHIADPKDRGDAQAVDREYENVGSRSEQIVSIMKKIESRFSNR